MKTRSVAILEARTGISATYFFRNLFSPQPIFISGDPRIPWPAAELDFRNLFLSATYLFPQPIFISGDPRISWRAAELDFRNLFLPQPIFTATYFRERPFILTVARGNHFPPTVI